MARMIQALSKWRFGPYRALVDRAGDTNEEEDAEVGVHIEGHWNFAHDVRELVQQLEQTPYNVNGSSIFRHWPRLARFVAKRASARVDAYAALEAQLMEEFQATYSDAEKEAVGPSVTGSVTETDDGVFFVDPLALLEMFTHALFVNPLATENELACFLDYYGRACEDEHNNADAQGGLFPTVPALQSKLGTPSPYCVVIARQGSPFYNYVDSILPEDFAEASQKDAAQRALQALPLNPALAHILTRTKHADPSVCYDVLPLWPYFAWKMAK